tara:strand:+ start:225 stop:494 length:270 start_codon:yes stop_codon:yes gene_type:complete
VIELVGPDEIPPEPRMKVLRTYARPRPFLPTLRLNMGWEIHLPTKLPMDTHYFSAMYIKEDFSHSKFQIPNLKFQISNLKAQVIKLMIV